MSAKTKSKSIQRKTVPASIVWFDIPADNVDRARVFYSKLFGWKIKKFPGMNMPYWHVDTGGGDQTPDGGMMLRQSPQHTITNYVTVASVDAAEAKVRKLGGKIVVPKSPVPKMGYFAVCNDTEGNVFAVWERNENAA